MANEITINRETGFVDIDLPIISIKRPLIGNYSITAGGTYNKSIVEIVINVPNKYLNGFIGNDFDLNKKSVTKGSFSINGEKGLNFVKMISEEYKIKIAFTNINNTIDFTMIPLEVKSKSINKEYVRIKIFHDDTDVKNEYFEMFLNINIPENKIEIHEKDNEYRSNIIKSMFNYKKSAQQAGGAEK